MFEPTHKAGESGLPYRDAGLLLASCLRTLASRRWKRENTERTPTCTNRVEELWYTAMRVLLKFL